LEEERWNLVCQLDSHPWHAILQQKEIDPATYGASNKIFGVGGASPGWLFMEQ